MLRIWVSQENFSFIDSSSCRRTCPRRDSIYPCCASCNSSLWAKDCCWSSLIQLLRDSTWCSCFTRSDLAWLSTWSLLPSRRDLPRFDGSACSEDRTLELGFPVLHFQMKTKHLVSHVLSAVKTNLPSSFLLDEGGNKKLKSDNTPSSLACTTSKKRVGLKTSSRRPLKV